MKPTPEMIEAVKDTIDSLQKSGAPPEALARMIWDLVAGQTKLGQWQHEIPLKSGRYHAATLDGLYAGVTHVAYDRDGKLVYAGGTTKSGLGGWLDTDETWGGLWWSEPLELPPLPRNKANQPKDSR